MSDYPIKSGLIKKYDVPTPRYTSYPTVPHWNTKAFSTERWINAVRRVFEETNKEKGISLYLHLPFCEKLCTYCACNKRITKNHGVEIDYIRTLLKEWNDYLTIFGTKPFIRELHLGGGTPTFFSPENLKWLVSYLLEEGIVRNDYEFSFEGHPNNTTADHLQTLYDQGFTRVSYGVQDLDPKVQKTINRIQPFENVARVTHEARSVGFKSVNFDLIYGLPFQTVQTIENTIQKILFLKPDRVAFYGYAHVPWVSPGQRGYNDTDLPTDIEKRRLYETGRQLLKENGYEDVGMDHFALPHDSLFRAQRNGSLHRNFMGYTTTNTELLIGLGASAISDAKYAYAQNLKVVEHYSDAINNNRLAVFKGHQNTPDDIMVRRAILQLACNGSITFTTLDRLADASADATFHEMWQEGIIDKTNNSFVVTEAGRMFIRNICGALDKKLRAHSESKQTTIFSKSI